MPETDPFYEDCPEGPEQRHDWTPTKVGTNSLREPVTQVLCRQCGKSPNTKETPSA